MLHPAPAASATLESKFTALDLKAIADDGAFEGYASLFNREDLGHDIVLPGAFRDSLARRGPSGIKLLFQHNASEPIGIWDALAEDARGLFARGRLMLDIARAREIHALMRAGAIDGLSIGFRTVKARRDRAGVRRLEKIDLWEISVVTFPMQPEARVAAVKQLGLAGRMPTGRELERWLTRDAGLTRSEARALLRHGLKGLAATREPAGSPHEEAHLARRMAEAARRFRFNRKSAEDCIIQ
jgi:HK97 family phage prohead protease